MILIATDLHVPAGSQRTAKEAFSSPFLFFGPREIHGFTERQCKEIYTLINLGQTRNTLDQRVNLAKLHSLVLELKKLSSPKKFEGPLVIAIILRLEEGLKMARKQSNQKATDETLSDNHIASRNNIMKFIPSVSF